MRIKCVNKYVHLVVSITCSTLAVIKDGSVLPLIYRFNFVRCHGLTIKAGLMYLGMHEAQPSASTIYIL